MASTPELASQQSLVAVAAGRTDVGRRRDHNEDQILVNDELQLFAVADGMGGHQAGDVASSIAAASLEEFFWEERPADTDIDESLPDGARRLVAAIHHCNREVFARSGRSANQGGMGSTVVAMHLAYEESLLHIVHVGDSRCYRIRNGEIQQLTLDHSMINEALRLNPDLSPEILKQLPSNVVTRALGTKEDVQPDVRSEPLVEGDIYLLCSDGLSGEVSDEDMLFSVLESEQLTDACELLVAMANEAGGRDNISALLVRVVDASDGDYAGTQPDVGPLVVVDGSDRPRQQLVTRKLPHDEDDDLEVDHDDEEYDEDEGEPSTDRYDDDDDEDDIDTPGPDLRDDQPGHPTPAIADEPDEDDLDDDDLPTPPPDDFDESHDSDLPQPPQPPRARLGLSALEPEFGSVSTISDVGLSLEPPKPPRSDHPYAEVTYEAIAATGDASRAPAFAVVGVGELRSEPPPAARHLPRCRECGHRLLPEERFCGMCGAPTEMDEADDDVARCDACGHEVYLGTRYCVECGVRHGF